MAGLSRRQLSTVAWLRWRLFVRAFDRKGVAGEIAARIIMFPVLACFAIAPAAAGGFAGYYAVTHDLLAWLAAPLWVVFVFWQFVALSTSTKGPSFDLTTLTRFPIGYRDYLIVRLSFGLLDAPTLLGGLCLASMAVGIGIADAALFPWSALALFVYGVCNILFTRMLYSWMEKWLAQRRTREIVAGFFILISLSFQMINPLIRRLSHAGHRPTITPAMRHWAHVAMATGQFLPPGLAGMAIARAHPASVLPAAIGLCGVLCYVAVFLYVLSLRLRQQYLGENLSEAPAATVVKRRAVAEATVSGAQGRSFLPPVIGACFEKEVRYLLRSGPMLFSFITPLFMVVVFSMQSYGRTKMWDSGLIFSTGCAYLQIFLAALLYNCFGMDGTGTQLYFFAPVRIRDVVLAKNALSATILAVEMALIYGAVCLLAGRPGAGLTVLTLAWVLFAFVVSMTFGNLRSVYSPKKQSPGGMRSNGLSGVNGLIGFAVLVVPLSMGATAIILCLYFAGEWSYWIATGGFAALAAAAIAGYIIVLGRLDGIAAAVRQDMTEELCKT